MNGMEELLNWLQNVDPLWSVALVAIAIVVLLGARLWRASAGRLAAVLVLLLLLAAVAGGGFYGYTYLEGKRTLDERRALDERAASILSQAVQPGSVFACLDGSPAPTMLEACERSLFAEPQRVAAAVAIVTQRIAFLSDALQFAAARDESYLQRIEPLRNSIEADPYGFVAYVFAIDHRCTAEACERFRLLRDPTRVKENIRIRRFEAFMVKHSPSWRAASPVASEPEPVRESPLPPGGERPSVSGVSIGERAGAVVIGDPTSAGFGSAPAQSEEAARAAAPAETPSAEPATDAQAPRPQQTGKEKSKQQPVAAKNPPEAKDAQPAAAAKSAAPKSAAKAKTEAAAKRSSEPVAGLPRIVPRDFAKDKEEEPAAQASGQGQAQPGAPISITPQQN